MHKRIVLIVGGGNIGTTLACYIKHFNPSLDVRLYVRDSSRFAPSIKLNDIEHAESYEVSLNVISDSARVAATGADVVFIALPHFAVQKAVTDVSPYVSDGAYVGVIPGSGGSEFFFEKYFGKRAQLFGFQRVPFVARLVRYGQETNLLSWKSSNVVGTLQKGELDGACKSVEACGLKTIRAENYLAVSLTPSNPIIHTACVYGLFHEKQLDHKYPRMKHLYEDWGDKDSETMLAMDDELHSLFDCIPELDMSSVRPLTEHYESPNATALTQKIHSILAFRDLLAPMTTSSDGKGYCADTKSRMFTEDFPFGLAIIRAYCEIFGVEVPTIDRVLRWYADWLGLEYYCNGHFCGADLASTGIPQNFGISKPSQVLRIYQG